MVNRTRRSYPPTRTGPVTWNEVEHVLRALLDLAATCVRDPAQADGPANENLIDLVTRYRDHRSRPLGKQGSHEVLEGDLRAFDLHTLVARVARSVSDEDGPGVASGETDAEWPVLPADDEVALQYIEATLHFEAEEALGTEGGGGDGEATNIRSLLLAPLAEGEGSPSTLRQAVKSAGGPTQYADHVVKQLARFSRHTREALQKALEGPDRARLLAHVPPDTPRKDTLRYLFEMMDLHRLDECETAIRSVFGAPEARAATSKSK